MGINVIGLGVGHLDYFLEAGKKILKASDIIIGGKRQLESISPLVNNKIIKYQLKSLDEMKDFINLNLEKNISIIVSGDTGYYSLLSYIKKTFQDNLKKVIPGISSYQYLFSCLGETWQDYLLCSNHGRELDLEKKLDQSNKGLIILTDNKNNPYILGKKLWDKGYRNIEIIVGENLSYEDEKITKFMIEEIDNYNLNFKMNVMVIRKCI